MSTINANPERVNATHVVELSDITAQTPAGPALLSQNLRLLQGVKVTLSVVVGAIETTVDEVLSLKEFSVLKVERPVDQPVDVLLNGNLVARGQLVAVDDNFGVRVTEICTTTAA
ncbi:flagellar motor switch protein FliN [Massilia sp. CCM 8695]|uniref:Flagellar motor switch protein FliN n=1 Tax=Massilia frigida TaxID=2609281 RepID=A0ABX0NI68_9BURK|nr:MULTISPECIES: FliM/FliN family flagellar motor switch protein [Massilia]MDM5179183.1 FliM/FliN family flagellar motor switch protein [Massilia sp. DJPM01]NHZ80770.1 flagellar motor switch protein FliN [Massilia frigida]